ncbi:MAG: ATP-dependent metalloprotease FtsH, cell division protease FtsH [Candidatus Peregrinibacteria bacterium GW2011_GWC2_39_14]|nr:MAG: ATP-dependent zinc metalloprotease FtsH [Candidatus Peregrinibacteria bacterium GW2011_GWA2_38_36]KKR04367.1 MAG: ATP-dependent metalloprotease FtsH, cell division protease FtsH [Candidatus Peregrinibacteria bacterium GW2011_GWC2_39_14]
MNNMKMPENRGRGGIIYLLIIALVIAGIFFIVNPTSSSVKTVPLSTVVQQVKDGVVGSMKVTKNKLDITLADSSKEVAYKDTNENVYDMLEKAGVPKEKLTNLGIEVLPTESSDFWLNILISAVPFLLIIGFFVFMMRSAQNSNNQAMSFGKSKARLAEGEKQKTTFKDVAGAKEAKQELFEIVDFLKNPLKYTALGAKIPKGVLLVGPPGCGKTLLARAVAGEANVPFFNISGSEFVEMFVGVGASRVRDLFKKAKRNAPCIIFIDEIDAVGRHRGAGMGGGHDEREQTLNQILTEMDGFEQDTNVIVISATNRPDILDPALLRPGRFDRRVTVDAPDIKEREEILNIYAKNKPLDTSVDISRIAKTTPGFTGADLENLMNEGAILAARKNAKVITREEIEQAVEKVTMGPERKSRILSKEEKKIIAHHEVGHAIVAHLSSNCDPVHKISVISRGMALGVTWFMPEEDKHLYSKNKFQDEIASMLGGYSAEQIIFGDVTTGASNDLERATGIARKMVTEYGMSDLGPITYGEHDREIFLGRDFGHMKNYSEEIASKIDSEVRKFVEKGHETAKKVLNENVELLKKIAKDLMEKETLNSEDFLAYFGKSEKHAEKIEGDKKAKPIAHPTLKISNIKGKKHA